MTVDLLTSGNDARKEVTLEVKTNEHGKVNYMISMVSSDFSKISIEHFNNVEKPKALEISKPHNEPIIGVIDTFF